MRECWEDIEIANWFWDDYLTPEQRLLVGIFTVALKDYLCPESRLPPEHRRSAKYYFETLRTDEYGSFGHFCEMLDLDPDVVREKALSGHMAERLEKIGAIMKRTYVKNGVKVWRGKGLKIFRRRRR